MQAYNSYSVSELATDDYFIESCLNPTSETERFWDDWLEDNPEKNEIWQEAKIIIKSLSEGKKRYALICMPEEKVDLLWNKIQNSISKNNNGRIVKENNWKQNFKWVAAASVILFLSVSTFFISRKVQKPFQANSIKNFIELANESLHEEINNTNFSREIRLSDNSIVTLFPKSSIQYTEKFNGNKREVFMTGKAFFNVSHDAKRPFFVYTNEIVTKVLGTKFLVSVNSNNVNVSVQSGKVAVTKRSEINYKSPPVVVLLPNQQVNYAINEETIVKSIITFPDILKKNIKKNAFEYDDTPIAEVFEDLEKAYEIHIIYSGDNFSDCTLTASLVNQPFFTKIDLICEAIHARYEVLDGQIFISGAGCK